MYPGCMVSLDLITEQQRRTSKEAWQPSTHTHLRSINKVCLCNAKWCRWRASSFSSSFACVFLRVRDLACAYLMARASSSSSSSSSSWSQVVVVVVVVVDESPDRCLYGSRSTLEAGRQQEAWLEIFFLVKPFPRAAHLPAVSQVSIVVAVVVIS